MRNEKGQFVEGNIPWHKGKRTGIVPRSAFKEGFTPWNKGKKIPNWASWTKKPKIEKTCPTCNTVFYSIPSKANRPYCSQKCVRIARRGFKMSEETRKKMSLARSGSKNYRWNGGKTISNGYVCILQKSHPHADMYGYIRKSRYVMEKHLGRILKKTEVVHHIDGNRLNDIISNLILFPNQSAHLKFHHIHGTFHHTHGTAVN